MARQCLTRLLLAAWLALCAGSAVALQASDQDASGEGSLAGRLASVEREAQRLSILADGDEAVTELVLDPELEIRIGDEVISLSDLVSYVGYRIEVRYSTHNGERRARAVTVDVLSRSGPARMQASDPIPRA